jgi:acyl carrier protein
MDNEAVLRQFLKERFGGYHDGIGPHESLEGIVDSLGLFELVDFLEERFQVAIPNEEFSPKRFESIESILQLMDESRRARR